MTSSRLRRAASLWAVLAFIACGKAPRAGVPMSLEEPPHNVEVVTGTWGTDFDEDDTVFLSGERSLKFISGTPVDPIELQREQPWSVQEGRSYTLTALVRADSVSVGNTIEVAIDWYDLDMTLLSTGGVGAVELPAANTWIEYPVTADAPANARFAKARMVKANTAFNAWLDSWSFTDAIPCFFIYRAGDQTIAASTTTDVVFNANRVMVDVSLDTGTGVITFERSGKYLLTILATFNTIAAAKLITLQLIGGGSFIDGSGVISQDASPVLGGYAISAAVQIETGAGGTVKLQITQADSVARDLGGTSADLTWIRGYWVGPSVGGSVGAAAQPVPWSRLFSLMGG